MKEFIDKLIARLEEYQKKTLTASVRWAYKKAISIVNELAEEYKEDCCECKRDYKFISNKYKVETGCGYTFYDLHHAESFKYCPYCGKKIKVLPYTEGE